MDFFLILALGLYGSFMPSSVVEFLGKPTPTFCLPRLGDGGEVKLEDLRGQPTVLVFGSSRAAAPQSGQWMIELEKRLQSKNVHLFQIAVLHTPWYMPNPLVRRILRDAIPQYGHPYVLLDYSHEIGAAYGIPWDPAARVLVLDRQGVLRWLHLGDFSEEALHEVTELVEKI